MNNLREEREEQGLTIKELAEKINVHFTTVSDWELEKTVPRPKRIIALSNALNIPKEKLFPDRYTKEILPEAICGRPDRPVKIGDLEIPCYVLSDGTRVLHQRGMVSALGMARGGSSKGGGDRLAHFVNGKIVSRYVSKETKEVTNEPLRFVAPNGSVAYGYDALILADICEAVLKAREEGKLQKQQAHIAERCEILIRGFARVGIIALVDEATGYQEIRSRNALEEILDKFISKELRKWAKTFPDEFYMEMFRLRGWQYIPFSVKRPGVVGR